MNIVFIDRFKFPVYRQAVEGAGHTRTAPVRDSRAPSTSEYPEAFELTPKEQLWAVMAEEHYLRLRGNFGERMIRHSFKAALAKLGSDSGLRVHRSHWVAFGAVRHIHDGKSMELELVDTTIIPVSKPHRHAVLLTRAALLKR